MTRFLFRALPHAQQRVARLGLLIAASALPLAASAQSAVTTPPNPQLEAAVRDVDALAQINGQALACQDQAAARRAKQLMLRHAPRTTRFGDAYDSATQRSFLAQTQASSPCPDAAALRTRLDAMAARLQTSLPASAAAR